MTQPSESGFQRQGSDLSLKWYEKEIEIIN